MSGVDLAGIIALARAGAIDEALRRFTAAGLSPDDPAALIVRGRLLKDLAARAGPEERRRLYRDAAAAYARSAQLQPATYPLINAATLTALAGDAEQAQRLAGDVLRSIEDHPEEPETPYYRAATMAEALLLSGREHEARAAFAEAIALAPQAWEDHATTLHQFGLILAARAGDAAWIEAYRPPRSLHFGGHMSFDPQVVRRDHLEATIKALIEVERVGFGYGALAAGADIIIAELLVAHGAELHAILPGGVEAFAAVSVDPFGAPWRRRFDALVAKAATVRPVRPFGLPPDPHAIGLSDDIAMGAALMNARRLESEAIQLLVIDGDDPRSASATLEAQRVWADGGRRQHLVHVPREQGLDIAAQNKVGNGRALAVIAIMPADPEPDIERWLEALRRTIASGPEPAVAPYWSSGRILLGYEKLAEAADLILDLARQGHRVGADYCIAAPFVDPFSNAARLPVLAHGAAEAAASSTPPGSACVTEDLAAALAARRSGAMRIDYVGELDTRGGEPPIGLYALKR